MLVQKLIELWKRGELTDDDISSLIALIHFAQQEGRNSPVGDWIGTLNHEHIMVGFKG